MFINNVDYNLQIHSCSTYLPNIHRQCFFFRKKYPTLNFSIETCACSIIKVFYSWVQSSQRWFRSGKHCGLIMLYTNNLSLTLTSVLFLPKTKLMVNSGLHLDSPAQYTLTIHPSNNTNLWLTLCECSICVSCSLFEYKHSKQQFLGAWEYCYYRAVRANI